MISSFPCISSGLTANRIMHMWSEVLWSVMNTCDLADEAVAFNL